MSLVENIEAPVGHTDLGRLVRTGAAIESRGDSIRPVLPSQHRGADDDGRVMKPDPDITPPAPNGIAVVRCLETANRVPFRLLCRTGTGNVDEVTVTPGMDQRTRPPRTPRKHPKGVQFFRIPNPRHCPPSVVMEQDVASFRHECAEKVV